MGKEQHPIISSLISGQKEPMLFIYTVVCSSICATEKYSSDVIEALTLLLLLLTKFPRESEGGKKERKVLSFLRGLHKASY